MGNNVIYRLSKGFALRIIQLYSQLCDEKREFVMSKQLYRSGTSIGANIAESVFAQSEADYVNKLKIALKEASESRYWLELLYESNSITEQQYSSLLNDVNTIIGTIVNIINKIKQQ
ncbi:MAG: four helix bundle protein [Prevotella sp.]|nr:four helix bundle protein [Prevotella sp.]